jgi:hypothetical protein
MEGRVTEKRPPGEAMIGHDIFDKVQLSVVTCHALAEGIRKPSFFPQPLAAEMQNTPKYPYK